MSRRKHRNKKRSAININTFKKIRNIVKTSAANRKKLFSKCDGALAKAICECAANYNKRKLGKNIRTNKIASWLSRKDIPLTHKKQAIRRNPQVGGALFSILGSLLPTLVGAVSSLFSK